MSYLDDVLRGVPQAAQLVLMLMGIALGAIGASALWLVRFTRNQYRLRLAIALLKLEKEFRAEDARQHKQDLHFEQEFRRQFEQWLGVGSKQESRHRKSEN